MRLVLNSISIAIVYEKCSNHIDITKIVRAFSGATGVNGVSIEYNSFTYKKPVVEIPLSSQCG